MIQVDRCAHFNRPLDRDGKPLSATLTTSKPCPYCGLPIVSVRRDLLGSQGDEVADVLDGGSGDG